jgi:hypothetical protein
MQEIQMGLYDLYCQHASKRIPLRNLRAGDLFLKGRFMKRILFIILAIIAIVIPVACSSVASASSAQVSATKNVVAWASTYDYWNNSPPGYGIEYAKQYGFHTVHKWACCSTGGTYNNPITFAAQNKGVFNLKPGTRIYIPYFKRYFILEDACASCFTNKPQVDLWVGQVSKAQEHNNSSHNIVNLWRQLTIRVNPPRGLPVSTAPFKNFKI